MSGIIVIPLLALNFVVLLGQLWPEDAPPFARVINIVFLPGSLICFIYLVSRRKSE